MNKNLLLLFLIILIINLNCNQKSDKVEIEFWTLQLSPVFNDYFNTLISKYEKSNPKITIKWVDIPYDAVIQKLLASLIAGDAPDVVNLSADFLSKFNKLNVLADLQNLLPDSIFQSFLPNALEAHKFNNKIVGLPWYLNTYTLIYNKEFIAEAGFSNEELPKTFKELIAFTKEYKKRTGKYALFCTLGKDSFLPLILESEGINLTDDAMKKCTFNTDQGFKVIDEWVSLYKEGYLQSESIVKTGSSLIEAYQSGQVAMVFTGPVFLKRVKENAENIYKNTDIAPAIVGKSGKHELAIMSISVINSSEHKKEASDFAAYICNAENQLLFSKFTTIYPSTTKSLDNEFFIREDSTLETKARVLGAKQISSAIKLSKYLTHPKFDLLKSIFEENIQNACLNKMSVHDAINKIEYEWNLILKQN